MSHVTKGDPNGWVVSLLAQHFTHIHDNQVEIIDRCVARVDARGTLGRVVIPTTQLVGSVSGLQIQVAGVSVSMPDIVSGELIL